MGFRVGVISSGHSHPVLLRLEMPWAETHMLHYTSSCVCSAAAHWIFAADVASRHDQMHLVTHHVQMPLSALANILTGVSWALSHASLVQSTSLGIAIVMQVP